MPDTTRTGRPKRGGPTLIHPDVLAARTPFARAMTERRIALFMSQPDLATATNVPGSSIAAYEVGVIRPGPRTRAKLEAVLGELPMFEDQAEEPLSPRQLRQAMRQKIDVGQHFIGKFIHHYPQIVIALLIDSQAKRRDAVAAWVFGHGAWRSRHAGKSPRAEPRAIRGPAIDGRFCGNRPASASLRSRAGPLRSRNLRLAARVTRSIAGFVPTALSRFSP